MAESMIQPLSIQPARLTLPDLRRIARSPDLTLTLALRLGNAGRSSGGDRRRCHRARRGRLRHQHRLRQARADAHPDDQLRAAAAQPGALAQRRRRARRSPTRSCGWCCCSRRRAWRAATRACARVVIDALLALLNAGVLPVDPAKGSVGASGDLAPLAHLALRADRRGRGRASAASRSRRARRCARRPRAARARSQGRPGAAQRHAGLDRARASTALFARGGRVRGGAGGRRAVGRCR